MKRWFQFLAAVAITFALTPSLAATTTTADLKLGLVLPMTGPFAAYGKQIVNGVNLYLAQNGETIAGRRVRLILKDDAPGTSGEVSRRLAQELIVKDNVDILAGFGLTPSAFAVAPIASEAKKPMIVMNAATSSVTTKSPYIVRVSMTLPQTASTVAGWAAKNGIRTVFTVVADYGPGHDAEAQFKKTFTGAGGKIAGELRVPVRTPDFAPYLQRVKDARPDAVFLFVPSGELGVAFIKGFHERGLAQSGVKLIATGDLADEDVLDAMGDPVLGVISAGHYSEAHASPENKAYVAAYAKAYPRERPNFMSVAGYDGMRLISEVLKKTQGDASADAFVAAARGLRWTSPRGPVAIDAQTRDIVQTIYIRRVERVGGRLQNVEFDALRDVRDPGKE